MTDLERFFSQTIPEPNSGCLLWLGPTKPNAHGVLYGRFWWHGSYIPAHHFQHRPLRKGWQVHHKCHTPLCVSGDHTVPLSPVAHTRYHRVHNRKTRRRLKCVAPELLLAA